MACTSGSSSDAIFPPPPPQRWRRYRRPEGRGLALAPAAETATRAPGSQSGAVQAAAGGEEGE